MPSTLAGQIVHFATGSESLRIEQESLAKFTLVSRSDAVSHGVWQTHLEGRVLPAYYLEGAAPVTDRMALRRATCEIRRYYEHQASKLAADNSKSTLTIQFRDGPAAEEGWAVHHDEKGWFPVAPEEAANRPDEDTRYAESGEAWIVADRIVLQGSATESVQGGGR